MENLNYKFLCKAWIHDGYKTDYVLKEDVAHWYQIHDNDDLSGIDAFAYYNTNKDLYSNSDEESV